MSLSIMIAVLATSGVAAGAGLWLLLRRRRKSPSEQDRRLAVNAVGRMTDGTLLEAPDSAGEARNSWLLFYRYAVAGVEYAAAQEINGLRDVVRSETCSPGAVATVKYDPKNPYNSIVVCELWNGLGADGR